MTRRRKQKSKKIVDLTNWHVIGATARNWLANWERMCATFGFTNLRTTASDRHLRHFSCIFLGFPQRSIWQHNEFCGMWKSYAKLSQIHQRDGLLSPRGTSYWLHFESFHATYTWTWASLDDLVINCGQAAQCIGTPCLHPNGPEQSMADPKSE